MVVATVILVMFAAAVVIFGVIEARRAQRLRGETPTKLTLTEVRLWLGDVFTSAGIVLIARDMTILLGSIVGAALSVRGTETDFRVGGVLLLCGLLCLGNLGSAIKAFFQLVSMLGVFLVAAPFLSNDSAIFTAPRMVCLAVGLCLLLVGLALLRTIKLEISGGNPSGNAPN
jgi:hypothetical protein